jgi:cysteate synthase
MVEWNRETLVVCSAGNTGRAFLQVASLLGVSVLVVVPDSAVRQMWTTTPVHPAVRLAVVTGGADYADAIEIGGRICALDGYHPEGGVRNAARRDGLGTVLLAAVEALGRLPRHYVQAVGSGTGGIAVWEMARRLAGDSRFDGAAMRLHLVQNSPYAPMHDAWRTGSRALAPQDPNASRGKVSMLHATMLGNRAPPYAITGGVFDALQDTAGDIYAVDNAEALAAGRLFEEIEGCDLDPAAEVALAGLIQAVVHNAIPRDESVLLNLTGGGKSAVQREGKARTVEPNLRIDPTAADTNELADLLAARKGCAQ